MGKSQPVPISHINACDMPIHALSAAELKAVEQFGSRVMLKFAGDSEDGAHDQVTAYFCEKKLALARVDLLDMTLGEIGVSLLTCNALEEAVGIRTVRDVLRISLDDVLKRRNVSPKRVFEVLVQITNTALLATLKLELKLAQIKNGR